MSERVEAALAEIARREAWCHKYGGPGVSTHPQSHTFILDVLRGDREVLERHHAINPDYEPEQSCEQCFDTDWPCPDAARVLDRYAPEPS